MLTAPKVDLRPLKSVSLRAAICLKPQSCRKGMGLGMGASQDVAPIGQACSEEEGSGLGYCSPFLGLAVGLEQPM